MRETDQTSPGCVKGELGAAQQAELARQAADMGLDVNTTDWQDLIAGRGGNGLSLKVTGETIRDLFGGSIPSDLEFAASTPGLMIDGLRQVLSAQMQRLSEPERHLLRWLAVQREPVSFVELAAELGPRTGRGAALEAIEGLCRRSLLERGERQARFTLHPVVLEYVTEQLIEEVAEEIRTGDLDHLLTQPLTKATARDYVRRGQERLIARPLLDQLVATEGGTERVERRLIELLERLRGQCSGEQGYGPGNLVNLLRLSRGNLRGVDLSELEIRQAFLQGVEAQDASLARSHLPEVVLADRGLYARWLFTAIVGLGWHPFLRVNLGGTFHPTAEARFRPLRSFVPATDQRWAGTGTAFKSATIRLRCTLLAWHGPGYQDHWLALTDLPPDVADVAWYGLRAWIEQGFKATKRGGWQWQRTCMTQPDRAERLWLAIAAATLWLVNVGGEADDDDTTPLLHTLDLALPTSRRARRATRSRRVGVFRRGWILILSAYFQRAPLPLASFIPKPWLALHDPDPLTDAPASALLRTAA